MVLGLLPTVPLCAFLREGPGSCLHPLVFLKGLRHVACRYGDGTARVTVEENILFPNVPEARLAEMQQEPIFRKYKIHAGVWKALEERWLGFLRT